MGRKRVYIALFIIYIVAVAALCFMKTDGLPQVERTFFGLPMDKVAHFVMFMPFPILATLAFVHKETPSLRAIAVLLLILAVGAGAAYGTEQIQSMTDYRSYDITDFYADMAGMGTGALITAAYILMHRR